MQVSLVSVCHSRALDQVLPSWLEQEGVDLDITVVVGPSIKRVSDPRITYIDWPDKELNGCCKAWNVAWKAAKGPLIYSGYSDMVLQDKRYIAKMCEFCGPTNIVSRQLWRADGSLDEGLWCYGFLTDKSLYERSGGWDESMDGGYGWEDTCLMHSLVEAGGELVILQPLPGVMALRHIDHPTVRDCADWAEKYPRNKRIYNKRFPRETLMDMYKRGAFRVV